MYRNFYTKITKITKKTQKSQNNFKTNDKISRLTKNQSTL